MILGTLRTRIIEHHSVSAPPEGGFYEINVKVDEGVMQRSGDVKAFAYKAVGAYLAQAITDTGVPVEYWTFEFDLIKAHRYGFPANILTF